MSNYFVRADLMKIRNFSFFALVVTGAFGLAGCSSADLGALSSASVLGGNEYQKISVKTVGVDKAKCVITQGRHKYRFFAPEVIKVRKTGDDLVMECQAQDKLSSKTVKSTVHATLKEKPIWSGSAGKTSGYELEKIYSYPCRMDADFTVFSEDLPDNLSSMTSMKKEGHEARVFTPVYESEGEDSKDSNDSVETGDDAKDQQQPVLGSKNDSSDDGSDKSAGSNGDHLSTILEELSDDSKESPQEESADADKDIVEITTPTKSESSEPKDGPLPLYSK